MTQGLDASRDVAFNEWHNLRSYSLPSRMRTRFEKRVLAEDEQVTDPVFAILLGGRSGKAARPQVVQASCRRGGSETDITGVRDGLFEMPSGDDRSIMGRILHLRILPALRTPETKSALRRYMVNTIFDSTFVILGVVIGSAFASHSDLEIVVGTILTSSVALAISTGVSVYEAESHEQENRVKRIESAMLRDLGGTEVGRRSSASASMIAVVNLSAPLIVCAVLVTPFLLLGAESMQLAGTVAIALAISMLFVVGAMLGRMSGRNPWVRGSRMAVIGFVAFLVCYLIESFV